jgi:transposase-like protein
MASVQEKAMCVLWFFEMKSVVKTQRRYATQYGKDPPSDNAIRRWLKQFQETGSVLHRKGAGRPSISQEDVDRIQEAISESPQKSIIRASLQLGIPQATVWKVVHNRLNLRDFTGNKTSYTFIFRKIDSGGWLVRLQISEFVFSR